MVSLCEAGVKFGFVLTKILWPLLSRVSHKLLIPAKTGIFIINDIISFIGYFAGFFIGLYKSSFVLFHIFPIRP